MEFNVVSLSDELFLVPIEKAPNKTPMPAPDDVEASFVSATLNSTSHNTFAGRLGTPRQCGTLP